MAYTSSAAGEVGSGPVASASSEKEDAKRDNEGEGINSLLAPSKCLVDPVEVVVRELERRCDELVNATNDDLARLLEA